MNDINNPLEDIKVQSALRSEEMKLSYRKTNNPKDVNILDYTVIAALEKQIPQKPSEQQLNINKDLIGLCPTCNVMWVIKYKGYCANCGQKLDWD